MRQLELGEVLLLKVRIHHNRNRKIADLFSEISV